LSQKNFRSFRAPMHLTLVRDAGQARATAGHLCDAVRRISVRTRNDVIRMTVSIGGALSHGESIEALLRRADEALYAAKRGGRDRVVMAAEQGAELADSAPSAPVQGAQGTIVPLCHGRARPYGMHTSLKLQG
jgi:hypothetical protein